jgi:hypothetical protein
MPELSPELIAEGADDVERAQYKILAALKEPKEAFSENRLYPHLKNLVRFYRELVRLQSRLSDYPDLKNKDAAGVDLDEKEVIYEGEDFADSKKIEQVFALVEWTLEEGKKVLDEGTGTFDRVESALSWEPVGVQSAGGDREGLLLLPDVQSGRMRALRYAITDVPAEHKVGIRLEEILSKDIETEPDRVRRSALEQISDGPAPTTHRTVVSSSPEGGWPYEETLRPVTKRVFPRGVVG